MNIGIINVNSEADESEQSSSDGKWTAEQFDILLVYEAIGNVEITRKYELIFKSVYLRMKTMKMLG